MATVVQPPPSSSLMWISRVWLSCSTLTRWCGLPCSCRPRIVRPGDGVGATNDVHRPLGVSGRCTVPLLPGCRVCRRPHPRAGVPVEGGLVLPRRRRPRRRGMGAPPRLGLSSTGSPTRVAGAIRRAATLAELDRAKRAGADAGATYLTNKSRYLDYPTELTEGGQ